MRNSTKAGASGTDVSVTVLAFFSSPACKNFVDNCINCDVGSENPDLVHCM